MEYNMKKYITKILAVLLIISTVSINAANTKVGATNAQMCIRDRIKNVIKELEALLKSYNNGRIINEGISTAIIGKPNVGKSSFLNFIMKDDRAIVTDIPGTTRDIIEYSININNITLNPVSYTHLSFHLNKLFLSKF